MLEGCTIALLPTMFSEMPDMLVKLEFWPTLEIGFWVKPTDDIVEGKPIEFSTTVDAMSF